jgi:hypothetical protein
VPKFWNRSWSGRIAAIGVVHKDIQVDTDACWIPVGAAVVALQASPARQLHNLFGSPDNLKFRSLFAGAAPSGPYQATLTRWCDGPDARTLDHLQGGAGAA